MQQQTFLQGDIVTFIMPHEWCDAMGVFYSPKAQQQAVVMQTNPHKRNRLTIAPLGQVGADAPFSKLFEVDTRYWKVKNTEHTVGHNTVEGMIDRLDRVLTPPAVLKPESLAGRLVWMNAPYIDQEGSSQRPFFCMTDPDHNNMMMVVKAYPRPDTDGVASYYYPFETDGETRYLRFDTVFSVYAEEVYSYAEGGVSVRACVSEMNALRKGVMDPIKGQLIPVTLDDERAAHDALLAEMSRLNEQVCWPPKVGGEEEPDIAGTIERLPSFARHNAA